jgi:hypothetical protein
LDTACCEEVTQVWEFLCIKILAFVGLAIEAIEPRYRLYYQVVVQLLRQVVQLLSKMPAGEQDVVPVHTRTNPGCCHSNVRSVRSRLSKWGRP